MQNPAAELIVISLGAIAGGVALGLGLAEIVARFIGL